MDVRLMIQSTPNPNALKFVLSVVVRTEGNVTYKSAEECTHNPLAKAIFEVEPNISEVYFFDNYITVTQNGKSDWDELEQKIQKVVMDNIPSHDPDFRFEAPKKELPVVAEMTPEVVKINSILDATIRPALQMDGGDLQIMKYENKILKVFYQGACGSCPSSSAGTLMAIENILKDEFDPGITVELAQETV